MKQAISRWLKFGSLYLGAIALGALEVFGVTGVAERFGAAQAWDLVIGMAIAIAPFAWQVFHLESEAKNLHAEIMELQAKLAETKLEKRRIRIAEKVVTTMLTLGIKIINQMDRPTGRVRAMQWKQLAALYLEKVFGPHHTAAFNMGPDRNRLPSLDNPDQINPIDAQDRVRQHREYLEKLTPINSNNLCDSWHPSESFEGEFDAAIKQFDASQIGK